MVSYFILVLLIPAVASFMSPTPCRCMCPQQEAVPYHCPSHSPCQQRLCSNYRVARARGVRTSMIRRHKPIASINEGTILRTKRASPNILDEVIKVDTNCNSEKLREIIIQNADQVTSVSKRQIQTEAEKQLGGRYNVICARGDFSYITNTEIFCQQTVGDVTCYAFKQLNDAIRKAKLKH